MNISSAITNDYLQKMSRLKTGTGALALKMLERSAKQQHRRITAEDEAAHKATWGTPMGSPVDDSEMNLGEITNVYNAPPEQPTAKSTLSDWAGKALVAGAVTAAPSYVAMQYLNAKPEPEATPIVQTIEPVTDLRIFREE